MPARECDCLGVRVEVIGNTQSPVLKFLEFPVPVNGYEANSSRPLVMMAPDEESKVWKGQLLICEPTLAPLVSPSSTHPPHDYLFPCSKIPWDCPSTCRPTSAQNGNTRPGREATRGPLPSSTLLFFASVWLLSHVVVRVIC